MGVWTGTAYYPVLRGLVTVRIPEGGTIRLEETADGTRMSHAVWMDFPNNRRGPAVKAALHHRSRREGQALRPHQQGTRLLQGTHRVDSP